MPISYRLGTVPFLNASPLVTGLDQCEDIELHEDLPARLAARLRNGELDAALVSSVELFRDPPLAWIDGVAITSNGPVGSILLYLRTAPEAINSVSLDSSSLSANVMARVCLSEFLGRTDLEVTTSDASTPPCEVDADAVLRIGDAALTADRADRHVLDLGELWTRSTGLPFVYALWLMRPGTATEDLAGLLTEARRHGHPRRAPLARAFARLNAVPPGYCVDYLLRNIAYDFGDAERRGLELFGTLAHKLGLVDRSTLADCCVT